VKTLFAKLFSELRNGKKLCTQFSSTLQPIGNNFNFRIHMLFPNKQITVKRYEY